MTTAKVWRPKCEFEGQPKLDDFALTEEILPPLKDNEILIEAVYLSLDPYMRVVPNKDGLLGEQVARIIDSKAPGFPKGALVLAHVGWRSRTVVDVRVPQHLHRLVELIEDIPGLSPSLWIGAIGMPGATAYLSFLERCEPKKGEIIVVSAASGAVGSIVGQLAKLEGLTVIGLAGSDDKCEYLKEIGFDHAINYKKGNLSEALNKVAPDGVDIYYDNVGGEITAVVYSKLRYHGRVLVCGHISTYNMASHQPVTGWNMSTMVMEHTILGFSIGSPTSLPEIPRVRKALISLFVEGKLKAKEHITEGFENMPKAFLELFSGSNFGKAVVNA